MIVQAKFKCDGTETSQSGDTVVNMSAFTGPGSEDFSKYTPWGQLKFGLSAGVKAAEFFEAGQVYTLDFKKAE